MPRVAGSPATGRRSPTMDRAGTQTTPAVAPLIPEDGAAGLPHHPPAGDRAPAVDDRRPAGHGVGYLAPEVWNVGPEVRVAGSARHLCRRGPTASVCDRLPGTGARSTDRGRRDVGAAP